jgi:hypothetical protein
MSQKLASSLLAALVVCGPLACASEAPGDGIDGESQAEAVGTATPVVVTPSDTAATVSVTNGLKVTLNTELVWRAAGASKELVLHGSTSQDITEVFGFIPDDSFGTPAQLGPRSFELTYSDASDIDTILSGARFWVELVTKTTAGSHQYAALVKLRPQLVAVTGGATSTRLAFGAKITPEPVGDNPDGIHYRGTVTTTAVPQSLTVTAGANPTLTQDAPHAWHFDWLFDSFVAAAQSTVPVESKGKFGATTSTRDARIAVRLSDLELALTSSPDDVWGFPVCDPAVAACLAGLPAGTIDDSACGDFQTVASCM